MSLLFTTLLILFTCKIQPVFLRVDLIAITDGSSSNIKGFPVNHEKIVLLNISTKSFSNSRLCHAVIVSRSLLLSRAACFIHAEEPVRPENVAIDQPLTFKYLKIDEIILHEAYTPDLIGFGDLAILKTKNVSWLPVKIFQDPWPSTFHTDCFLYFIENGHITAWFIAGFHSSPACHCMNWTDKRRTICGYSFASHDTMFGFYTGAALICNGQLVGVLVAIIDPKTCSKYKMFDDPKGGSVNGTVYIELIFTDLCLYIGWIADRTGLPLTEPISCRASLISRDKIDLIFVFDFLIIWSINKYL